MSRQGRMYLPSTVMSDLNFRKAFFVAVSAHVVLLLVVNQENLSPVMKNHETGLSITFNTTQKPNPPNAHRQVLARLPVDGVKKHQPVMAPISVEKVRPKVIDVRSVSVKAFVRQYERANKGRHSEDFLTFKQSFATPKDNKVQPGSKRLVEKGDGNIDVKTRFLGKRICYQFQAESKFPVANFYRCKDSDEFKIDLKR